MILVNDPGDWDKTWSPLLHADWNGWTPTDLIFPFFLFIVGVAISYAGRPRAPRSLGAPFHHLRNQRHRGLLRQHLPGEDPPADPFAGAGRRDDQPAGLALPQLLRRLAAGLCRLIRLGPGLRPPLAAPDGPPLPAADLHQDLDPRAGPPLLSRFKPLRYFEQ